MKHVFRALPFLGVLILFGAWQLASFLVQANSVFPSPAQTLSASTALIQQGYLEDLGITALRATAGWLLALAIGVPIGLILGLSRTAHGLMHGALALLRGIPAFMLIVIPIAAGAGGETSRLAVIAFASAVIIADSCAESLVTLPQDRLELLRVYHGGFWFILTNVLFFEALGRAVVPVARTTIGISFVVTIVAETLAIPSLGVGARLLTALSGLEMPSVYAFLLLTALTGLALNTFVSYLARRLIFWT